MRNMKLIGWNLCKCAVVRCALDANFQAEQTAPLRCSIWMEPEKNIQLRSGIVHAARESSSLFLAPAFLLCELFPWFLQVFVAAVAAVVRLGVSASCPSSTPDMYLVSASHTKATFPGVILAMPFLCAKEMIHRSQAAPLSTYEVRRFGIQVNIMPFGVTARNIFFQTVFVNAEAVVTPACPMRGPPP